MEFDAHCRPLSSNHTFMNGAPMQNLDSVNNCLVNTSDADRQTALCRLQIVNMFLPRVNCRRFASWYKDGEPADMSPTDSQVR